MNLSPLLPVAFFLVTAIAGGQAQSADDYRVFTNTKGQKMEARIVDARGDKVKIVRRDGHEFVVAVDLFSQEDQDHIASWKSHHSPTAEAPPATAISSETVNEAFGHEVFADSLLWDDVPGDAAKRLGWPRESQTDYLCSFRKYPQENERFLGARAYSAVLYGEEGKVTSLSLVFANKGDSFGMLGNQTDSEDTPVEVLEAAMSADVATISHALTNLVGEEGEKQRFGEGSGRQNVLRWDWNNHAFLLFEQEEEYVSLQVQPADFADAGGRVDRVKEAEVRERSRANVERRSNGDVVIRNIPMVDQGPKGYCVPATFERCMRYLGIPADMYLLAMAGETQIGGGTSTRALMDAVGRDIRRKGRGFDSWRDEDIKFRDLAKYIDEGIPVMWTMFSTDAFNGAADARTKKRREVEDWSGYAEEIEKESETLALQVDHSAGHITLIIGYNEETSEIAFSDSWGERYMERWTTPAEAQEVSQGWFYVVDF